ncbi:hypothetical protein [Asanoa iriomotensis]|uniref:hypothetical protein n=1 Tax=Asanoa iriomotensis TaxID=234613 RepID=UPI0019406563|nr:hypothetical protein [Asanoa iriomotensis]
MHDLTPDHADSCLPDAATARARCLRPDDTTASDTRTTATSTTRPRLPYGQLKPLILTHLRTYPHLAFTPWELAKVLGRSHGTIRRILLRLAETGEVDQTSQRPARFQHHS